MQAFESFVHAQLTKNTVLNAAMKYALLGSGKRIRPTLALESAQLISLASNAVLPCAFAIEIAHTFSLVHDDLPSMDNDDLRRGQPTVHKKFNEAQALLAGDALLNFAHQTFLECIKHTDVKHFSNAYTLFLNSIGTEGMILGQSEELNVQESDLNTLLHIQSLKTGALFKASILCPLLLAGKKNTDPIFLECEQFAHAFGFAFQIADDLDDETQDQANSTKNILSHLGRTKAIDMAISVLKESKISHHFSATRLLIQKLSEA